MNIIYVLSEQGVLYSLSRAITKDQMFCGSFIVMIRGVLLLLPNVDIRIQSINFCPRHIHMYVRIWNWYWDILFWLFTCNIIFHIDKNNWGGKSKQRTVSHNHSAELKASVDPKNTSARKCISESSKYTTKDLKNTREGHEKFQIYRERARKWNISYKMKWKHVS